MGLALKDSIIAADDRKTKRVDVPEWGGEVILRGLSGTDRDSWEQSNVIRRGNTAEVNLTGSSARLLVRALVDEEGNRLFADNEWQQLSAKAGHVLSKLADEVIDMSGLGADAVEDGQGNSESDPSESSTSD